MCAIFITTLTLVFHKFKTWRIPHSEIHRRVVWQKFTSIAKEPAVSIIRRAVFNPRSLIQNVFKPKMKSAFLQISGTYSANYTMSHSRIQRSFFHRLQNLKDNVRCNVSPYRHHHHQYHHPFQSPANSLEASFLTVFFWERTETSDLLVWSFPCDLYAAADFCFTAVSSAMGVILSSCVINSFPLWSKRL